MHAITSAPASLSDDQARRQRRYLIQMGARVVCFVGAIIAWSHVPRIVGQNYDYLVNALTEYQKGERSHPTMRAQAESMSAEDIRDIATYLSSITP